AWWLVILGGVLFGSIVTFGIGSAAYTIKLENDTRSLIAGLDPSAKFSNLEFAWLRFGIIAGTSSFVLAMFAWLALGTSILRNLHEPRHGSVRRASISRGIRTGTR